MGQLRPSSSLFRFLQAGRKVEKRKNDCTCKELMFLINKQTPMGREEKKRRKNHPLPDGEMGKDEDMLGVMFQAHPGRERPTGANKDRGEVSQGGKRRLLPKPEDQSTAINGSGT